MGEAQGTPPCAHGTWCVLRRDLQFLPRHQGHVCRKAASPWHGEPRVGPQLAAAGSALGWAHALVPTDSLGLPSRASRLGAHCLTALTAWFLPQTGTCRASASPEAVAELEGRLWLGNPTLTPWPAGEPVCGTVCPLGPAQTVCPQRCRHGQDRPLGPPSAQPRSCRGRRQSISLLIAVLLRPDLLLLAVSNLCHLYSVPSLNLQYTFCFSSPQPLSLPSTLMKDMCGIHLGIYLKTISHSGFNTFPHQGSTKLDLNEN